MSNKSIILVSQFINNFGSGFSRIALIILVTTWFSNSIYVGVYSFCLFVPNIVLATPIGAFIDSRRSQKKLLISTSLLSAIAVWGIVLLTYFKIKSFFWLVLLAIIYNIVSSFYMPSITKVTAEIFDRSEYNDINAAISTAMTGANLFSGIIVTFFISFLSNYFLFLFDFASYLIISLLLVQLKIAVSSDSQTTKTKRRGNLWNGLDIVWSFLNTHRAVVPVFLSALLFNIILAPNDVYLTQIASHVFHNPKLVGFMESCFSLGFLIGSITYKMIVKSVPMHKLIQVALVLVPVALLIFGETTFFPLSLLGLVVLGMALPFFNISSKTILQNKVDDKDLGTVFNSYFAVMNLTQPIGLLGIPILISLWGIQRFALLGGLIYLVFAMTLVFTRQVSPVLDE
ncbi:MFS transporter [Pediococcus siamensis]|uniref:MFS transporter n=1 Tax=Pediococcus siamensis TaxID=381829 RepID=UPI0039A2EEFF